MEKSLEQLFRSAPAANVATIGPRAGIVQFAVLREIEWNLAELPIADLPSPLSGLRILHLSDLHLRERWPAALDSLIARVRRDPPDLIVYTGDFVDNKFDPRRALPHAKRLLTSLPARFGAFAVLGNHDGDLFAPRLADFGVRRLVGPVELNINGAPLELIGLPGPLRIDCDEKFLRTLPAKRDKIPRIVLSHYPDLLRFTLRLRPDLYFAGHTHGGQICLPGGLPIIRHDALPRRLCTGVHRVGETWLIVSRGIGFATWPLRVFCPAEVIEVRLV